MSLTGVQSAVTTLEGNLAVFIKTENPASTETLTHVHKEVHSNTAHPEELEMPKRPPAGGGPDVVSTHNGYCSAEETSELQVHLYLDTCQKHK